MDVLSGLSDIFNVPGHSGVEAELDLTYQPELLKEANYEESQQVEIEETQIGFWEFCIFFGSHLKGFIEKFIELIQNGEFFLAVQSVGSELGYFYEWLRFTELQLQLLRSFVFLIFFNALAIAVAWKIYGEKIKRNFFTKPGVSDWQNNISELTSTLQLPKEHDFKMK